LRTVVVVAAEDGDVARTRDGDRCTDVSPSSAIAVLLGDMVFLGRATRFGALLDSLSVEEAKLALIDGDVLPPFDASTLPSIFCCVEWTDPRTQPFF
jgi:hypothetical protein